MCGGGGDGGSGGGDGSGGGGGGNDMSWWASRPGSNRTWASWRGGGARNAEVETANGMRLPCLRATVRCTAERSFLGGLNIGVNIVYNIKS